MLYICTKMTRECLAYFVYYFLQKCREDIQNTKLNAKV